MNSRPIYWNRAKNYLSKRDKIIKNLMEKHKGHLTTRKDVLQLRPVTESYEQPIAGRLLIFPNWLKHQVFPFFGEGERRSLAVNWNIFDTKKELEAHLNSEL